MIPIDYNHPDLRRYTLVYESDLTGRVRSAARRIREGMAAPDKLQAARLALHLTKKEAADFVKVSAVTYSLWEAGRATPTEKFMAALLWLIIQARENPPVLPYVDPAEVVTLRRSLQATRKTFAALLGVSVVTVARWETGKDKPSPENVLKLEALKQQQEEAASHG